VSGVKYQGNSPGSTFCFPRLGSHGQRFPDRGYPVNNECEYALGGQHAHCDLFFPRARPRVTTTEWPEARAVCLSPHLVGLLARAYAGRPLGLSTAA